MSEKLRGILINPHDKSVTEVQVDPYPAWKDLIEVDTITSLDVAINEDNGYKQTCWLDDEGLINEKKNGPFFKFEHYDQPLAGKGIILGTDPAGETVSADIPLEFVQRIVSWPDVVFEGITYDEPVQEQHGVFGDVTVHRQRVHFHERKEDEGHEKADKAADDPTG